MNLDRIDEATLALLYLGLHDGTRAWKSFDWAVTDRLFAKGLIAGPHNKAKSLAFTKEGLSAAQVAFDRLFGKGE